MYVSLSMQAITSDSTVSLHIQRAVSLQLCHHLQSQLFQLFLLSADTFLSFQLILLQNKINLVNPMAGKDTSVTLSTVRLIKLLTTPTSLIINALHSQQTTISSHTLLTQSHRMDICL